VTLELKDVPEDQALDLLLRSVAGYLAAPRTPVLPNASRFDRVVVMATAAVPRTPVAASPQTTQPVFNPAPQPVPNDAVEDEQPPNVMPPANPRGPLFNPFPQPQVVNPQVGAPASTPGETDASEPEDTTALPQVPGMMPGAVSAPGMIAPVQQPGQTGPTNRR
jgi:hypothetical protein